MAVLLAGRWRRPSVALASLLAALALVAALVAAGLVSRAHHRGSVAAGEDPRSLIGINWLLIRHVDRDGRQHPDPVGEGEQTLQFDGPGTILFTDNCNDAGGPVKLTSGRLVVGQVAETLVGCGQGDDSMRLLTGQLNWQLAGRILTITAPDHRALIFQPHGA